MNKSNYFLSLFETNIPLTREEETAFRHYFGLGSDDFNVYLRKTPGPLMNNVEEKTKLIDGVIKKNKVKIKKVYRGLYDTWRNKGFVDKLKSLKVGEGFQDPSFMSVTPEKRVAMNWSGTDGVILELNLKSGVRGVWRKDVWDGMTNENEILLEKGLKFKVIGSGDYGGAYLLKLKQI